MKRYGVIGYKGKIGSLLVSRPDFVPVDCDITDKNSILEGVYAAFGEEQDYDVIVNCAALSGIDDCEKDVNTAFKVNVVGVSNLHEVFGDRFVNLGTDQVFGGNLIFAPKEESAQSPVNIYGMTKAAAEGLGVGKTIRLSRTVSFGDQDIADYLGSLSAGYRTEIPHLFLRNFLTRSQAVDGIEFFVQNFDSMPAIVNYGSSRRFRMTDIVVGMCKALELDTDLISLRRKNVETFTPRPVHGGFSTRLAKKLGFPMYTPDLVIYDLLEKLDGN